MKVIMVKMGGLMEDPNFHWEQIGLGEGNSLREACDDLARRDGQFRQHYNRENMTYWGWALSMIDDK